MTYYSAVHFRNIYNNYTHHKKSVFVKEDIFCYTINMSKEDFENTNEEIAEMEDETGPEGADVVGGEGRTKTFVRKKSGECRLDVVVKAVFSFFLFVVILGGIGFGVVWLLDNERIFDFAGEEKLAIDDVMKKVDEKVFVEEDPGAPEETMQGSSSQNRQEEPKIGGVDLAKVPVLVLNAGGAKGSAGKVSDFLKKSGYVLAKAQNASVFTYKGVAVYYAGEEDKGNAEKIAEALKKEYSVTGITQAKSIDEKKEKVVVMVGE